MKITNESKHSVAFKNSAKTKLAGAALITAVLFGCSHPAEAGDSKEEDTCLLYAEMAEVTMKVRQDGAPMDAAKKSGLGGLATDVVVEAYDHPRYSTEAVKSRTISEFKNEAYLNCFKAISK